MARDQSMLRRLTSWLLRAYPPSLRSEYGDQMADTVDQEWRARTSTGSRWGLIARLAADCAASWLGGGRRPRQRNAGPRRHVWTDLRDAWRLFRRSPGFAAGAVLTIALGAGGSTAILSLADATLLRPLPVPQPDRLLQATFSWSYPDFRDLAAESRTFSTVAGWGYLPFAIDRGGETLQVNGAVVSSDYFTLAGQRPVVGRLIGAMDNDAGAPATAVISERLWERAFERDPSILGRAVNVNRQPVTIVGVTPAGFRGLSLQTAPEIFVPLTAIAQLSTGFFKEANIMNNRGRVWLIVGGRLSDGATPAAAADETRRIYYSRRPPETKRDTGEWFTPLLTQAVGLRTAEDLRRFVTLLLVAAGLALLLTCATVANLLLVRAAGRRREFAVRMALGAGRTRLARLLVIEGLGIGLAGGLAGIAAAAGTLKLLESFALPGQISITDLHLRADGTMMAASTALGMLTALIVSLAPMRQATSRDPARGLQAGARVTSRHAVRSVLVGLQVALCVVLLVGSLAFGRAIRHALALDLGFNVTETSITAVNPSLARYSTGQAADLRRRALDDLRSQPGIRAAAWAMLRPLSGGFILTPIVEGDTAPAGSPKDVQANLITDGYFQTMGIPIVEGRDFTPSDGPSGVRPAIVSAALAKRYWGDADPLGRRLSMEDRGAPDPKWLTVVGVAGDIHRAIGGPAVPILYVAAGIAPASFAPDYLMVRSAGDPAAELPEIRAALRRIDPAVPITSSVPMASHVAAPLMAQRLGFTLFLLFSGLAAALTILGVYSVVSASMAQRRREIGIRMALGAASARVVQLVIRQGLAVVVLGLIAGLAVSAVSAKIIEGFLFSIPAISLGAAAAIVAAIGMMAWAAMLIPARRALAIDPAVVLRAE